MLAFILSIFLINLRKLPVYVCIGTRNYNYFNSPKTSIDDIFESSESINIWIGKFAKYASELESLLNYCLPFEIDYALIHIYYGNLM